MNTNYVGPRTRARFEGQVGEAFINGLRQPVTVVSVRGQHNRLKLTVRLADASTVEITRSLYIEPVNAGK